MHNKREIYANSRAKKRFRVWCVCVCVCVFRKIDKRLWKSKCTHMLRRCRPRRRKFHHGLKITIEHLCVLETYSNELNAVMIGDLFKYVRWVFISMDLFALSVSSGVHSRFMTSIVQYKQHGDFSVHISHVCLCACLHRDTIENENEFDPSNS